MKSMRFKTQLMLSFSIIIILSLCVPAYYIFQTLEKDIYTEAKENAFTQLGFVHWLLEKRPAFENSQALDQWCQNLSEQLNYRITIIAAGGNVLADSDVPYDKIKSLDNHADREEITAARSTGRGASIRYSITLDRKLIYAARNINIDIAPSGVLRVAIPLSTVEARLDYFNTRFWGILVFIFILFTLLSVFLARRLEKPILTVIETTTAIGEGDYGKQVDIEAGPEFTRLAAGINDMSNKIRQNIFQITEQKQELEAVLEGMAEGVMMLDKNGSIKSTNQALTQIARCIPSCEGRRPMEVFLNPEIQEICDQVLKGDEAIKRTVSMNNDTTYEVNLVKIPDGGAVVVFHDVSQLIRLAKVRQDFVANVSHELRTPLTSIKGYAETLLDEKFRASESSDHFVKTIIKNANQMSNIVNDLLGLTKLQQSRHNPHELETVNATACFKSAEETCMPMLKEKNIRIDNQLSDPLPVKAEENSLIQVFRNVLDNAIRHSLPETRITVFLADEENGQTKDQQNKKSTYIFGIQDEGTGIPRRYQKRIFERFYRVDKERSRESGGTGLGLSICRNAIAGMGGKIWLKSPPDNKTGGSVFFIQLNKAEND